MSIKMDNDKDNDDNNDDNNNYYDDNNDDNNVNLKNYKFLNCDWFIKLISYKSTCTCCYQKVCYRTVQRTNQIQSCSLNQPITFKVVI